MRTLVLLALLATLASCKKSPMDRVEAIREQLAGDSPRWDSSLAPCAGSGCAALVAKSIGGTFDEKKPDQISAAAITIVVAHDHRHNTIKTPKI